MQEKSEQNFPFNTQVQEKAAENDSWLAAKTLATLVFRVDSGKNGPGDILQSDISHLQLNTLLCFYGRFQLSPEIIAALIGGVCGLATGLVGSLIAPWIHWGIERKRSVRDARISLLRKVREHAGGNSFGVRQFAGKEWYSQLRHHLPSELVEAFEEPDQVENQVDGPVEFREITRAFLLKELSKLEKTWGLI